VIRKTIYSFFVLFVIQIKQRMKVILDERESALYSTCNTLFNNIIEKKIQKRVLELGDILIVDDSNSETNGEEKVLVMIERKTITDLLSSIKDGRYEEQSHRLQNASGMHSHNIIYILEGMFSNSIRNPQEKKIVLSAITSLNYFKGYSVIRTCSITETAELILNMVDKIERDMKKGKTAAFSITPFCKTNILEKEDIPKPDEDVQIHDKEIKEEEIRREVETKKYCEVVKKVKKENITKENMGEIILCQIPGISSTTAIAIMNYVDCSLLKLLDILKNSPEELQKIKIGKTEEKQRRISKKSIENMTYFLL